MTKEALAISQVGKELEDKTPDRLDAVGVKNNKNGGPEEAASHEFAIQCRNVVDELAGMLSKRENCGKISIVVAPSGYISEAKKAGREQGIILTNVKDLCNDLFDKIAKKWDAIRNAFLVRINKYKTVSDLRKDIWKEISNDFEGAYKLILFKVDIPVNDDTDPGSKILADNIKNQQELLPVRMVESYFKEDEDYIFFDEIPNNMNIRIIIRLPTEFANNRIKFVDNTTKFFNELLRPFNEEVSRDNVEQLLSKLLLLKLHINCYCCGCYEYDKEGITMGNIDSHINILIEFIQEYERGCSNMSLDRNQAIQSSTTTTENKRYRPDSAVYYNRVLVMMGEAKGINTKLEAAETQLDGYCDYWNTLALPFVMAFAAAGTTLQFYYYYPGNYKPERTWNCEQYLQVPKIKLFEEGNIWYFNRSFMLKFTPVGYLTIPKHENELRDAIWDVLNVVNNLHANRIVHRDIHWDNSQMMIYAKHVQDLYKFLCNNSVIVLRNGSPTPKGKRFQLLHEEDCVIRSQLIFTNFDVYYSELENVIIYFAEGVNSFAKEVTSKNLKTEHLQFNSRIYDDYKINDTFQQT
ncbi:14867_t:CDS:10, partial [Funneliformis mosseae]